MSNPHYPEEFKIQAVNQVTEKKLPAADVAARLGVSTHSHYAWIKRYRNLKKNGKDNQHSALRRLRAELKRFSRIYLSAEPNSLETSRYWFIFCLGSDQPP